MRIWQVQRKADDEAALLALGLSSEPLLEAVLTGLGASEMIDYKRDPRILRGILVWGKIFGGLCRALQADGWEKIETKNWPRMVNAADTVAIAVMAGDANTGHGADARPRYRRGRMASIAVKINQLSLELDVVRRGDSVVSEEDLLRTYFLLYFRDAEAVHVFLGLPSAMSEGEVKTWAECITVGSLELVAVPEADAVAGRQFDVSVEEKHDLFHQIAGQRNSSRAGHAGAEQEGKGFCLKR